MPLFTLALGSCPSPLYLSRAPGSLPGPPPLPARGPHYGSPSLDASLSSRDSSAGARSIFLSLFTPLPTPTPEACRGPEGCPLRVGVGSRTCISSPSLLSVSEPAGRRAAVPTQTSGCCPTAVVGPPLRTWQVFTFTPTLLLPPQKGPPSFRKEKQPLIQKIFINIISLILVISMADSHFTHGKTEAQGGQVAHPGSHGSMRNPDKASGRQE